MLRSFVDDHPEDWDLWCTNVEFVINDSRNESTGISPFEMTSPSPPMSKLGLFVDAALKDLRKRTKGEGIAFEFPSRFHDILEEARARLELAQQKQRAQFDSRYHQREFVIGDLAWVEAKHLGGGASCCSRVEVPRSAPATAGVTPLIDDPMPEHYSVLEFWAYEGI
eukprot:gene19244-biopygen19858